MRYERDNIRRMDGYRWGEQPDDPDVAKLNTNENPWAPSPAVARTLAAFDIARLRRYPAPYADGFRRAAAEVIGTRPERIIATNGGDELLRLAITTFLEPGRALATTRPSYSLYPVLAAVQDCPTVEFALTDEGELPDDLAEQANAAGAGLLCIVNPHAPTGRLYARSRLADLAERFEGVLLVDEAYVDFVDPALSHDTVSLVSEHDNVLLLRTLSKGYALAGLRLGFGVGCEALLEPMLTKTRDSYNVDLLAQEVATAAISDRAWATDNHAKVRAGREALAAALRARGLDCPPTQTNFLLARLPSGIDARAVKDALATKGILVRWFDAEGLRDALRISVGTEAEHDRLLAALDAQLAP